MDTENESLPTEERTSIEQQTDAIAQVPPQTGNAPLVGQPVRPVPRIQRITRFLEDVRPTPGSNVTRIFGLSDCVIAVAFTLVIVNIRLPPEGLNESQLQRFITHNILSDEIPFYLATYLVVASSWISHYRIITYLKRSSSLFIILNVLFLASIFFLPVPVAFFYQYGNQIGSLLVFACARLPTI
jgi:Endosomal/lysosomal potassium channel TMEM175